MCLCGSANIYQEYEYPVNRVTSKCSVKFSSGRKLVYCCLLSCLVYIPPEKCLMTYQSNWATLIHSHFFTYHLFISISCIISSQIVGSRQPNGAQVYNIYYRNYYTYWGRQENIGHYRLIGIEHWCHSRSCGCDECVRWDGWNRGATVCNMPWNFVWAYYFLFVNKVLMCVFVMFFIYCVLWSAS